VILTGQGGTSQTITKTGTSPGAQVSPQSSEGRSSQITTDSVAPPGQEAASSESVVNQPAPVVDSHSSPQSGVHTEPARVQPAHNEPAQPEPAHTPAEPDVKLNPPETQHNQQVVDPVMQQSPSVDNVAAEKSPIADDTVSEHRESDTVNAADDSSLVADEPVSDDMPQHRPDDLRDPDTESVDSHSADKPLHVSDSTEEHRHYQPVNDDEQTPPAVESGPAATQDDAVKQHLAEDTEEKGEWLTPSASQHSATEDDSQQGDVDTDRNTDEPDDSDVKRPTSEDVEMQLNREDSGDMMDEQLTVADDTAAGGGYLMPVISLWAPVDTWLITCINSVSSKCVKI